MDFKPSKPERKIAVIPDDLIEMAPGEQLSTDFFEHQGKDYILIVDRVSGHLFARITRNKTQAEAIKAFQEYFSLFGLAHRVRSDGGPGYQSQFVEYLKGLHIDHAYTSSYHASSNGMAERGVRSIKEVIKKDGRPITKEILGEIVFRINCHQEEG